MLNLQILFSFYCKCLLFVFLPDMQVVHVWLGIVSNVTFLF